MTVLEVTHSEDVAVCGEKLKKQFAGLSSGFRVEKRFVNKEGDVVWAIMTSTFLAPYGFLAVEDISKLKRLGEALKESESGYHSLVDQSPDGIAVHAEGKVLFVNRAGVKMLGGEDEEDLIGRSTLSFVHPDSLTVVTERMRQMMIDNRPVPLIQEKFVRLDGTQLDVEVAATPIIFRGKKAVQVVIHDITDRRRSEGEMAEARARLEAILEGIGEGVFVVDDLGRIIIFNRSATKITGYSFDEAVTRNYWEVLRFASVGLVPEEGDFVQKVLSSKKLIEVHSILLSRKENIQVMVSATAAPVFGQEKNLLGVVVVFRDVTAQHEAERTRDEFMMIASHELRAPMTAIKWLVSMILEGAYGPVDENLSSPLAGVVDSTDRLIHLVNDMIDVTRIEGKSLKYSFADFDVKKLIDCLTTTFESEAKGKKITLRSEVVPGQMVQADGDRAEQILANLVDNAIRYNKEGGSILLATTKQGDFLEIGVVDTGVGISDDFRNKLFVKFGQILSKKGDGPGGTGLGLFISREMARDMGGDLFLAKSEVGKGSTFVFRLPLSGSKAAMAVLANLPS